ncbi:GNAT family N-acetyltransferase [Mesorhizobium caraganae]|uniref:GNAT family N-acetyltransferase n=1 Tax=Mesorhizobium caraganae TaxID=483206 RepID=UPI0019398715|nr:GNAT family N-acetyltransferase [Mesorhizobium caraganae]
MKGSGELIGMAGLGVLSEAGRRQFPAIRSSKWDGCSQRKHWGKGLASAGARAWLDYAWSIGLPEVAAFTAKANAPSQKLMQGFGMIYDPAGDYENPQFGEGHCCGLGGLPQTESDVVRAAYHRSKKPLEDRGMRLRYQPSVSHSHRHALWPH